MINATKLNDEVYVTQDDITKVDRSDIEWLKAQAAKNPRERVRLCTHLDVNDAVHEMLIVHTKGTYVRPHKHPGKTESFHLIEGALDIVIFEDSGEIMEHIRMGDFTTGNRFFWRLSSSLYHTVIPRSDTVVFHETTSGPFDIATSKLDATWSPEEGQNDAIRQYLDRLEVAILDKHQSFEKAD
mgnify:CR=1 FL=1